MSKGLIGKKIGMTNIFDEDGRNFAVTVIEVEPCVVTQIKTEANDGYEAVQLASYEKREKTTAQPQVGHFEKAGVSPRRYIREFKGFDTEELNMGDELKAEDVFSVGNAVDIAGISKGKGFTGVMKRHNFSGVGEETHGQHKRQRHPGSIGQASDPARVLKGTKMAGRSGNERTTVKNLTVARIFEESNMMMVTGAVPGANGGMIEIYNR
jgi:large subunit ribosomal protein L3